MFTNYNPKPTRVWTRVQNTYSTNQNNTNIPNNIVYVPLANQYMSPLNAQQHEQMLQKGNILQYKNNSSNLTKSQKYSQMSKGINATRKKSFATQSETYTNPNMSSMLRVNYVNMPYQNNPSGPFQTDIPNPFNCSSNIIQEGGSLVVNTTVDPCSGQIIKTVPIPNPIMSSTTQSGVPGVSVQLAWYPGVQSWYPRQRTTMPTSLDKWPEGYKGFVSAIDPSSAIPPKIPDIEPFIISPSMPIKPEAPTLTVLLLTAKSIEISWAINITEQIPITSFNIYVNNLLVQNVLNNRFFIAEITNLNIGTNSICITALSNNTESKKSNVVYLYFDNQTKTNEDSLNCTCNYFNKILNNNTVVQINTYLLQYINTANDPTDTTNINMDTYNTLSVGLTNFSNIMDPSCCFYNTIFLYQNILDAITLAFSNKNQLQSTITAAAQYKEDSQTLRDMTKLQDYLKTLGQSMKLFSFSVEPETVTIKPQYAVYNQRYGMPDNLKYDPTKLSEIMRELGISI